MNFMNRRWFFLLPLIGLVVTGVIIRLPFIGQYADSFDAVDFALGVVDFNVHAMQPHFPGYTVLMISAAILNTWLEDAVLSLAAISAVSGAMLAVPVFFIARQLIHPRVGWIAAAMITLNPLVWLYSLQPMSDIPGIFLTYVSVAFLVMTITSPKGSTAQWVYALAAVIMFGLAMGVRLSYFPFALLFLVLPFYLSWSPVKYSLLIVSGLCVVGSWVIPTAYHEGGFLAYWAMGTAFTEGHFTEWGGTALGGASSWTERVAEMIGEYWLLMGGAGWLTTETPPFAQWLVILLFTVIIGYCIILQRNTKVAMLLCIIVPYLVWALIGQNADKPRHMLILVPILVILLATLINHIRNVRGGVIILGLLVMLVMLSYGTMGHNIAEKYARSIAPTIQLTHYLQEKFDPSKTVIFTWEEERVISYYQPLFRTERLKSPSYFVNKVLQQGSGVEHILVTNHLLDGFGPQQKQFMTHFHPVASFHGERILYPTYYDIILYESKPTLLPYLKSID